MSAAKIDRTEITIGRGGGKELFIAKSEILLFDGFFKVYGGAKDDIIVPDLKPGQEIKLKEMLAIETFTKPPARYSEASLVKKLEELGIGRPSTYAPTISTIQTRGYVEKGEVEGKERKSQVIKLVENSITEEEVNEIAGADSNKLLPTYLAEMATDFLVKYFGEILDYDFTAKVEEDFDNIAEGKQQWADMLKEFYKGFLKRNQVMQIGK